MSTLKLGKYTRFVRGTFHETKAQLMLEFRRPQPSSDKKLIKTGYLLFHNFCHERKMHFNTMLIFIDAHVHLFERTTVL